MTNDERDAAVHCLRELSEVCAPIYEEALRLAIAALSAPSRDIPEGWVIPPDEWVRDYAKRHCTVRTGDHWKADAWNLKCAFRAWAEAAPPAPGNE
jgi:hypothetical protein